MELEAKEPKVRFGEFTGEWEEEKLGTYLKTPEKIKIDVKDKSQLLTVKLNLGGVVAGANRETLSLGATTYYRRHAGQFIYGKQNFFNGSMAIIPEELDGKGSSGDVPSFDITNIDSNYLMQYVSRKSYWKPKVNEATGTGSKRIHEKTLQNFDISIPSRIEQNTIGKLFNELDYSVALHQQELEQLKESKKTLLSKMFPKEGADRPEIRFAGFTDSWELRKLGEIATMNARIGWQNLRTSEFLDSGDYMLITGTDFKDGKIDYSNIHYVEKERYDQDKKIQIKNDSILITKDGTLGKVAYIEGLTIPTTLNAGVFNVRVRESDLVDSQYLFHYLKAPFLLRYAAEQSTGGTIKHLNQSVLVNFPIPLPNKQEQHKLGLFFKQLDDTITLHQKKLENLKALKKTLLNLMFV